MAVFLLLLMYTDGALLAKGGVLKAVDSVRLAWKRFLRFKVLFLGLPVSAGQSHLRLRNGVDPVPVMEAIHRCLQQLAKRHKAMAIVLKEFDDGEMAAVTKIEPYGYFRVPSLPNNVFEVKYRDFEHFLASQKSHTRCDFRRSERKFARAGMRVEQVAGSEDAARRFTDEVYALYENVWNRAENKLEKLPAEFFRELARQLGSRVVFTFVYKDGNIVGFNCSLRTASRYQLLFLGIDYELNRQSDLYFNIFYREMDFAMKNGARTIFMGQTSEAFKSRLDCQKRELCFYVGARGVLRSLQNPLRKLLFSEVH